MHKTFNGSIACMVELYIKNLNKQSFFLGVKIVQNCKAGSIWIRKPICTEGILKKYGMENRKPVAASADDGF